MAPVSTFTFLDGWASSTSAFRSRGPRFASVDVLGASAESLSYWDSSSSDQPITYSPVRWPLWLVGWLERHRHGGDAHLVDLPVLGYRFIFKFVREIFIQRKCLQNAVMPLEGCAAINMNSTL